MPAPTVFLSYSHKDEKWKNRLLPQLRALEQAERIIVWDDRKIDGGDAWYPEIEMAMNQALVSVCLISADYLASRFCIHEEVPYLLERRKRDGMILIPVLLRPCPWHAFTWLKEIQMLPRDGKSVAVDFHGIEDAAFADIADQVYKIVDSREYVPVPAPRPRWSPPLKVDTTRLPQTGAELFGRRAELGMLDAAWDSDRTHVVTLVASGGVGKSTLVNKWLEGMAGDNYRGARRVYAWSFYSQGTNERVTSADLFIQNALEWFGDLDPTAGSVWDKGNRLARLVRTERTLLLLDGLEPLQSGHAAARGTLKDAALATLLVALARENSGLCVVTTREPVTNLRDFAGTVLRADLEQISGDAGRALLRVGGARGTDAELERATSDFGNHALAVRLLAAYLRDIPDHHVRHAAEVPDLEIEVASGKHPRRVMTAFQRRFGDGPEIELLRMLGLFDRPADTAAIAALRAGPAIANLTGHINPLSELEWVTLVHRLRRCKLISPQSAHLGSDLDAHPLVREHFAQQLAQQYPDAWREGHSRLYEHLTGTTKMFPDTLDEMAALYTAVAHGCAAGRHDETLSDVYWKRIQRRSEYFSVKRLGALGADTAALASFFEHPWDRPAEGIRAKGQSLLLDQAGEMLHASGRLTEALAPLRALLERGVRDPRSPDAVKAAINLSELTLTMGDLSASVEYGIASVEHADRRPGLFHRQVSRSTLANALYQSGALDDAARWFSEAETIEVTRRPSEPLLSSVQGHQYCEFLMGTGAYRDAEKRATQTLQWACTEKSLLAIALSHISLGRAQLLEAQWEGSGGLGSAKQHLQDAVDGLRQAGTITFMPKGLLARAELYRFERDLERAHADVDEAMELARRSCMRLYEADCHIEYARLEYARGNTVKAQGSLQTAKEMIQLMGYRRRDADVGDIEQLLAQFRSH